MSGFFGDLVVPQLDVLAAARDSTAADISSELEKLGNIAASRGLDVWDKSVLIGSGPRILDRTPIEPPGVSMSYACLFGRGFWRADYLHPAPVSLPGKGDPTPLPDPVGRLSAEQSEIRGPEVNAVAAIASAASGRLAFPVQPVINIQSHWVFDFDVAYRRWLAYGLAYEASIRNRSLEVYSMFVPCLLGGTTVELSCELDGVEGVEAFSITLNLANILYCAHAYERQKGAPHPDLSCRIVELDGKVSMLLTKVFEWAAVRGEGLTDDARVAIQGLLSELAKQKADGILYRGSYPKWGSICMSDAFQGRPA